MILQVMALPFTHVHPTFRSATNITVRIPVPKATVSVSHEALGPGQVTELRHSDKIYLWKIKKIDGGDEQILLLKVNLGVCVNTCTCISVMCDYSGTSTQGTNWEQYKFTCFVLCRDVVLFSEVANVLKL